MLKKVSYKMNNLMLGLALVPGTKLAATDCSVDKSSIFCLVAPDAGQGELDPTSVVVNIINWALFFVGAIALIFVVYGGILLVTSGGDAEKTKKGRDTLLYAILGIIIIVLAYGIIKWATGGATTILEK